MNANNWGYYEYLPINYRVISSLFSMAGEVWLFGYIKTPYLVTANST